jgi:hypothetical protein
VLAAAVVDLAGGQVRGEGQPVGAGQLAGLAAKDTVINYFPISETAGIAR